MPKLRLLDIKPTQLYISADKLARVNEQIRSKGRETYEPIPVKRIGNELFFTDGHTRALALWRNGTEKIEVIEDTDEMDWIMYLPDLQWCRDAGITSIADLDGRVVAADAYQRLWIDRCSESHDRLVASPIADLEIGLIDDSAEKGAICDEILRSLPEWFGIEEAIVDYIAESRNLPFAFLRLYGKVIGFCALKIHYSVNCDLYVLGIFREFHRRGVGRRMIEYIETYCRDRSIPYMTVKTLSEKSSDENYRKTRAFYEACGFVAFEEFPTLWGAANPCLYMMKAVDLETWRTRRALRALSVSNYRAAKKP